MRGFRLNGWQRIGIVLSVVWAIVGSFWGIKLVTDPEDELFALCLRSNAPTDDIIIKCTLRHEERKADLPIWSTAALVGLAPIPIVWLLAYGVRWIRRGFQPAA